MSISLSQTAANTTRPTKLPPRAGSSASGSSLRPMRSVAGAAAARPADSSRETAMTGSTSMASRFVPSCCRNGAICGAGTGRRCHRTFTNCNPRSRHLLPRSAPSWTSHRRRCNENAITALAIGLAGLGAAQAETQITGAGSTFAAPIYAKWGEAAAAAAGIKLNYQAIGSGAGINQINNRTVDFGASDMPVPADAAEGAQADAVPHRDRWRGHHRQPARREAERAEADRRADRRHLPRQDHQVERSEDRRAQSRR